MKRKSDFTSLPLAARCTIVLFAVAGLAAALYAVTFQPGFAPGRIILLLALAAASARIKVNLFKGSTLSFLTCAVFVAVLQEGPAVAILVGLCGVTVQALFPFKKIVLHRLAFNSGMIVLTVAASWWTHHALVRTQATATMSAEVIATVLASFTYFLGNSISVSLIVALTKGMSLFQIWSRHFLFSAPSFLIAGLLALAAIAMVSSSSFLVLGALLIAISVAYYCSVRVTARA